MLPLNRATLWPTYPMRWPVIAWDSAARLLSPKRILPPVGETSRATSLATMSAPEPAVPPAPLSHQD